jgi:hypothetical protein
LLGSRIAGSICLKIGADGAIIVDGEFVALCLLIKGDIYLAKQDAYLIAQALGADCAAAVLHSADVKIPYTYFKSASCNEPPSAQGPSNGQPTIVATLTPTSPAGIPLGSPVPLLPPTPNPTPTPSPGSTPLPAGEFYVMNADGGIYWRSAPDWSTAEVVAGNGFYPGTVIKVSCYRAGVANVPGSSDSMWEQASWVSGPGRGSGWLNEHFINDGQPVNQPSPGVPACASPAPPQTWSEQETPNHPVNTFTNYHNASGMGQPIAAGQWVQVSCKVYDPTIGSVNPDGYWYRIASAPWNNAYYSPANTFMNGDPYGGPYTHNTDFTVPNC